MQNGLAGYLSTVIDSIKFAYSPVSAVVNDLNQFSIITDTDKFNAVLGVLQKENIISRIAAPYIIIKSGIEGKISIGDKIPILASTIITDDTTTQNVVYRETGLSMSVKPDVIGDQVNLNLNIEISSGEMNKLSNINSPSIKSRNLTSTIICKNSSAVLIGGIYQNESLFSQSGLPISNKYVQDYLNYNDKQKTKIELLFYVRPVILNNEAIAQLSKI